MAVDDTFPRSNLPDLAVDWGRTVQDEIRATQRSVNTLSQFTAGQNRTFASSLEQIARQLADIRQAQLDIVAAQDDIVATQDFLLNQTVYAATSGTFIGGSEFSTGGAMAIQPYDPNYDVSIDLTTSSTGRISATVSSVVYSAELNVGCGLEVVGVSSPDQWRSVSVTDGWISASRQVQIQLSGDTTYTFRTRRWYSGNVDGLVGYGTSGLSLTKIGR